MTRVSHFAKKGWIRKILSLKKLADSQVKRGSFHSFKQNLFGKNFSTIVESKLILFCASNTVS